MDVPFAIFCAALVPGPPLVQGGREETQVADPRCRRTLRRGLALRSVQFAEETAELPVGPARECHRVEARRAGVCMDASGYQRERATSAAPVCTGMDEYLVQELWRELIQWRRSGGDPASNSSR